MGRRKKKKLAEVILLPNVLEWPEGIAGKWNQNFFNKDQPITLEIGCGKGEYTEALAERNPDKNFLGIDSKGDRIWTGAFNAYEKGLKNAGFLRIRAEDIGQYFAENEVSEIWLTFPDPFVKPSKRNRRLASPGFLKLYRRILQDGGQLHLKTDNEVIFETALESFPEENFKVVEKHLDLHGDQQGEVNPDAKLVKTKYETMFMDESPIKYARCVME